MLIADLGVNAITGREIAKRPQDAASILGHNLGLRLTLSVVFVPIVSFLGFLAYQGPNAALRYCVVIAACAVPFDALRSVCLGYFVAGVRNHIAAVISLVQQVIFVGFIIVALWLGWGVIACVYVYLVATAVTGITTFVVTRRNIRFGPRLQLEAMASDCRPILEHRRHPDHQPPLPQGRPHHPEHHLHLHRRRHLWRRLRDHHLLPPRPQHLHDEPPPGDDNRLRARPRQDRRPGGPISGRRRRPGRRGNPLLRRAGDPPSGRPQVRGSGSTSLDPGRLLHLLLSERRPGIRAASHATATTR